MNSDDDWGIIAVFAIALIVWPIAAIVLAIRYYIKGNNDRMIGAICSFLLVFCNHCIEPVVRTKL